MGVLVTRTMTFNIFTPPIEFVIGWLIRYLKRAWDQRTLSTGDPRQSRSQSIQQFTDLYSGSLFIVTFKYCYILTVVYIAFFFGPGVPFLFIIALLSILSLYITERLCMAYVYQRPPIHTTALNNSVLKMLAFAPFFYVVIAAWLYSNQQVFRNTVVFNSENYLFPQPDHRMDQF